MGGEVGPKPAALLRGPQHQEHDMAEACAVAERADVAAGLGEACGPARSHLLRRSQYSNDHVANAYDEQCGHVSSVAEQPRPEPGRTVRQSPEQALV